MRSVGARDFSLWACVQAARVARAARKSGAMHPALCRSAGTVRQLQCLPHAYSVHVV